VQQTWRRRIFNGYLGAISAAAVAAIFIWAYAVHARSLRGPYRIGWEQDAPEQVRGGDGQPTGVAIEVVREAARRRGIELHWVERRESSEAALRSGAVDLWPLMTITPERLKAVHISAPYLDSVVAFMVLDGGPFREIQDLSREKIGHLPLPINRRLALQYLPNASLVVGKSTRGLIESLCRHELSAVLIEQDEVIHDLMRGGAFCGEQGFSMIAAHGSRVSLGIGSTFQASAAADAIRAEIDEMSAEGVLQDLFAQWGYLSGRNPSSVAALLAVRQREHYIQAVAALFGLLFCLALWHTFRYRRESTRARRAESALRAKVSESQQMQDRLRLLAHALWSANDCISITDTSNHLLYVNQAFLRTYEYTESELMGRHVSMLRCARAGRDTSPNLSAAIAAGSWRGEIWNRSKSGREFPISLATSHVRDGEGKLIAMVAVASDITERRHAEQEYRALQEQYLQAQKLESIGRLAGGVAHDFNNLLTIINGYCELILSGISPSDKNKGQIEQIHRAGERAAVLTQQLLAFSRKQAAHTEQLDINKLVSDSKDMFQRLLGEDVRLETNLAPHLPPVAADSGQIHQVLMNLLVNARDAMPDGGEVRIATAQVEMKSEPTLLLSFSDTGIGMDQETQSHVFEPFFTTKPLGKGTGLGLSTVYGIVKQNRGSIELHSRTGRGTTFHIYLPIATCMQIESTLPSSAELETFVPSSSDDQGTILVVEDQSAVREFIARVLMSSGYQVLTAPDGKGAIAVAQRFSGPIHIVLTDVVMPGMNGCDLIEELKLIRPTIQPILMSGYAEDVIARRGALNPGVAHITKPFTPNFLVSRMRELLNPVS
jgi:PAS domain S-box-containing protein